MPDPYVNYMPRTPTSLEASGTPRRAADGEMLEAPTRLVVAPGAGSFEPATTIDRIGTAISRGQVVGYVTNAGSRTPVTSPFAGLLETVFARPTERLNRYQLVLSLRMDC